MSLHPQMARLIDATVAAGRPALSAGTPGDARRMLDAMRGAFGTGPALPRVEDLRIPTRAGSVPGRLYAGDDPAGLVVYLHGGGWVLGGLDDFDACLRVLAARSGCALLSVDYRLAPEYPFPAAPEDACDAVRWAHGAMAELFGRSLPLAVAGDSAGGNLAAVAAAELRGTVPLAGQVLVYPVTDGDLDTPSYGAFGGPGLLSRADMAWFFDLYAPGAGRNEPRLHPAARVDLAGLPPAWVVTAGHDVLRDAGEAYAARLREAGVPTTLRREDGMPHGFIRLHNLAGVADEALTRLAADLRGACA